MVPPIEQLTAQGYDLQFGTNVLGRSTVIWHHPPLYLTLFYLGHFYFTKLLLPALLAGTKTSPDGKARIVNVSSSGHLFASGLDFNAFKEGPARTKKGTQVLYAASKLVCFLSSFTLRPKFISFLGKCLYIK